jgi:hypothetical protein
MMTSVCVVELKRPPALGIAYGPGLRQRRARHLSSTKPPPRRFGLALSHRPTSGTSHVGKKVAGPWWRFKPLLRARHTDGGRHRVGLAIGTPTRSRTARRTATAADRCLRRRPVRRYLLAILCRPCCLGRKPAGNCSPGSAVLRAAAACSRAVLLMLRVGANPPLHHCTRIAPARSHRRGPLKTSALDTAAPETARAAPPPPPRSQPLGSFCRLGARPRGPPSMPIVSIPHARSIFAHLRTAAWFQQRQALTRFRES